MVAHLCAAVTNVSLPSWLTLGWALVRYAFLTGSERTIVQVQVWRRGVELFKSMAVASEYLSGSESGENGRVGNSQVSDSGDGDRSVR